MTTALFLSILIFILSLWFLASPFVAKLVVSAPGHRLGNKESLRLHKEEIILTLDELELDYQLQKMSKQDYEQLYAEAMQEGAGVLKKIEESDSSAVPPPVAIKFCHQCGAKLLEASKFCSQCGTGLKWLIPILLTLFAPPAFAQMPEHIMPEVKRGELHGVIYQLDTQEKKMPLIGQNVGLMVFNQGQRVLILEKDSDAEGKFIFKNIFQDPDYSYSLGSIIEGQLYVLTELQLAEGKKLISVDFQVGIGSPNAKGPVASLMQEAEQAEQAQSVSSLVENQHEPAGVSLEDFQKITLVLSGFVLLLALIILARGPQRV